MLGHKLVTKQTGSRGRRCDKARARHIDDLNNIIMTLLIGLDSGKNEIAVRVLLCDSDGQSIQGMGYDFVNWFE